MPGFQQEPDSSWLEVPYTLSLDPEAPTPEPHKAVTDRIALCSEPKCPRMSAAFDLTIPIGSFPTPPFGYLPFYKTGPNHKTRYPKRGFRYDPRDTVFG